MEIAVTFNASKAGEIKRFVDEYYERDFGVMPESTQLTFIFHRPLEAHDIVSVFIDNSCDFDMQLWVDMEGLHVHVTTENLYAVLLSILTCAA